MSHRILENQLEFGAKENINYWTTQAIVKKLELKEMLYIRKYKPSLNVQKDSQLFTFIIRNSKQQNDISSVLRK